jgi:hypothetical protein
VPEQDLLLPPSLQVCEDDECGYPPYHSVMLTKVLVFAAGNQPDCRTIADFRKRHLAPLQVSSSRCCGWPVSWARRTWGGWRAGGAVAAPQHRRDAKLEADVRVPLRVGSPVGEYDNWSSSHSGPHPDEDLHNLTETPDYTRA